MTDNRNQVDADAIYDILEKEIISLYCGVSEDGVPHGWVSVMKETIKSTRSSPQASLLWTP